MSDETKPGTPVPPMSPELFEATMLTLYHHPRSSEAIVLLLTGLEFAEPPPKPTPEQEAMAHDIVEETITKYYEAFLNELGEDPETDWTVEDPADNWS